MSQESMGGQEEMGGGDTRVIATGTTLVADGATVSLVTFSRRAGEHVTWGGWPEDVAGLALGSAIGFTLWIERTATPQQATLRAKNGSGAERSLDWFVRGIG